MSIDIQQTDRGRQTDRQTDRERQTEWQNKLNGEEKMGGGLLWLKAHLKYYILELMLIEFHNFDHAIYKKNMYI